MFYNVEKEIKMITHACYIEVDAHVRYWEDAYLNGQKDTHGNVPCRKGDSWMPVIDLESGVIINWTQGIDAQIHYKVCDAGEYYLLDEQKKRIAKWNGFYVPDDILCINDEGWGDYIIFNVNQDGKIKDWTKPIINNQEWN